MFFIKLGVYIWFFSDKNVFLIIGLEALSCLLVDRDIVGLIRIIKFLPLSEKVKVMERHWKYEIPRL